MMVSGEYAVLDGAPAIVAAVQARAVAHLSTDPEGSAALNDAGLGVDESLAIFANNTEKDAYLLLGELCGLLRRLDTMLSED